MDGVERRWRGAAFVLIVSGPTWLAAQTPPKGWLIGAGLGIGSWFSQDVEALRPVRDSRWLLDLQLDKDASAAVGQFTLFLAARPPATVVSQAAPVLRQAYAAAGTPLPAGVPTT